MALSNEVGVEGTIAKNSRFKMILDLSSVYSAYFGESQSVRNYAKFRYLLLYSITI